MLRVFQKITSSILGRAGGEIAVRGVDAGWSTGPLPKHRGAFRVAKKAAVAARTQCCGRRTKKHPSSRTGSQGPSCKHERRGGEARLGVRHAAADAAKSSILVNGRILSASPWRSQLNHDMAVSEEVAALLLLTRSPCPWRPPEGDPP